MARIVAELADSLESHASNRANFNNVSDEDRRAVAKWLTIARVQAQNEPNSNRNKGYKENMRRKRNNYFYQCGRAGIDMKEARAMWSAVVEQ